MSTLSLASNTVTVRIDETGTLCDLRDVVSEGEATRPLFSSRCSGGGLLIKFLGALMVLFLPEERPAAREFLDGESGNLCC